MPRSAICAPDRRAYFFDLGAEAIVLAGTVLSLAFNGPDPGYPVIDALDVHVGLLADLATGTATL